MSDVSERFDRVPQTDDERSDPERPTRAEIVEYWADRFGIDPDTWADHTFWERGKGKIWAVHGEEPSPVAIQGLGMTVLRTRREHWKPTSDAVSRFGHLADECVIHLADERATRFLAGEDQAVDWDGDWGYLIVTHDLAGQPEPIGVGLYVHDELRSQIPKGSQREL